MISGRPAARRGALAAALALACCVAGVAAPARSADDAADRSLRFLRDGRELARLDVDALRSRCGPVEVAVEDPYYARRKRFHACPLDRVLALGFGGDATALGDVDLFLRARDGYVRPSSARQLAEQGAFVAFADAELTPDANGAPRWEPIDRRQLDPAPFYLVWSGPDQGDPHRHPWPYQLVAIEIAPFESRYPHTVPRGAPADGAARAGYAIFRRECVMCHAINGEGGVVGPELNVPRSIVEYRPASQIRAYIRDPQSFRYTTMPSHRHLSDAQLDQLIAYFEAMQKLKYDPKAGGGSP